MKIKLPVAARNLLRMELRNHPQNKLSSSEINLLRKDELLTLAKELGIDVQATKKNAEKTARGMEAYFEEEDLELYEYSEKYPAFTGAIEFDLHLELFGIKLDRKARLVFEHTPEWEYYDLNKNMVMKGWPGGTMHIEVLATEEEDLYEYRKDKNGKLRKYKLKPYWKHYGIFEEGVIPMDVFSELDCIIENYCAEEDEKRRATFLRSQA